MGFFEKLGEGLRKTRDSIFGSIAGLVNAGEITDELYDDLEEQLILADTGADVAMRLVEELRQEVRRKHLKTGADALEALKGIIREMLRADGEMQLSGRPAVVLVIGVNGVGKTTSIAKLAHLYKQQGKRVMLAAGDTFRAAAAEQLCVWAERADVPVVKHNEGADPAAVLFDAVQSAAARGYDMVICDTAGRLHNKKNLMDELSKISRVVHKACGTASVETLLVLDAITGQNAISQASQFIDAAGATGIVLTKLDGKGRRGHQHQGEAGPARALCGRGRGHGRPDGIRPGRLCGRAVPARGMREDGAWNSLQRPTILERWPRCAAFWSAWATPSGASARPA